MKYYEKLATRTSMLQGYAVATYVLLVVFCITALTMGAALLHYKRKNLSNEKALHTRLDWTKYFFKFIICLTVPDVFRDYNSWVSNMNKMKAGDAGQNNYEIK